MPTPGTEAVESVYIRADGVRIAHDPFLPEMAAKYGLPGATDDEGFNPYADTVGAGIYGGIVKRDAKGDIVIGKQYQNHNQRPGPVYAGGGYTPLVKSLKDMSALNTYLEKHPEMVNDVTTGGAQTLHMCGMGRENQRATATVVAAGGDIEALDTYGMTPLHRMASNNLAEGARALLEAGADPNNEAGIRSPPLQIAEQSMASEVIKVLKMFPKRRQVGIKKIIVSESSEADVNCEYEATSPEVIPDGFRAVCQAQGWSVESTWKRLAGEDPWFLATNGAYIYWNRLDKKWWIDAPGGSGVFIAKGPSHAIPANGWTAIGSASSLPLVRAYREEGLCKDDPNVA